MSDPVTGYVIYYQPKGGAVSSDKVSGGETESHILDGLQRGVTYIISIVALSDHLPSLLVRPVTVTPGEGLTYLFPAQCMHDVADLHIRSSTGGRDLTYINHCHTKHELHCELYCQS